MQTDELKQTTTTGVSGEEQLLKLGYSTVFKSHKAINAYKRRNGRHVQYVPAEPPGPIQRGRLVMRLYGHDESKTCCAALRVCRTTPTVKDEIMQLRLQYTWVSIDNYMNVQGQGQALTFGTANDYTLRYQVGDPAPIYISNRGI